MLDLHVPLMYNAFMQSHTYRSEGFNMRHRSKYGGQTICWKVSPMQHMPVQKHLIGRYNKSTFVACNTHWPARSAYASDVERRFLAFWVDLDKWPWRSMSMSPIFNTSSDNLKMHIWGKFSGSSSNPLQVIAWARQISDNSESKWPKWPWGQGQWPPFPIPTESISGCMFGANLVIPFQICDEFSCGQAEFARILSWNIQNDLEGQGQCALFSIAAGSIPWCMFGANLVILTQVCDELSCRRSKVYEQIDGRADRRTDAGNDNATLAWK